jgi:large subunit ribosomal protein L4
VEGGTAALEVVAWTPDGAPRPRAVKLPADPFDGRVHRTAMHEAVKVYLANQRQGTAQTKTRGFVSGGNQKPWRQKGTGRARQGSTRAPNWPGGGKVFGPIPRSYRLELPKKVRRLARTSALNARAQAGALQVIAPLVLEEPKTKRVAAMLGKMGLAGEKVLLLTAQHSPNVVLSARNIPGVRVLRYGDVAAYDVLRANRVLVEETALGEGELEQGAEVSVQLPEAKRPKSAKTRGKQAEAAEGAAADEARPAAKKAAAKKAARPAAKKAAPAKAEKKPAARKPAAKKTTKASAKKPKKKS